MLPAVKHLLGVCRGPGILCSGFDVAPISVHVKGICSVLCCAGVDWKAVAEYVDISKDLEIFLPKSDAVG